MQGLARFRGGLACAHEPCCLIRAEKWGVLSSQKLYCQEKRTLVQTACLFDPVNHLSSFAHMYQQGDILFAQKIYTAGTW